VVSWGARVGERMAQSSPGPSSVRRPCGNFAHSRAISSNSPADVFTEAAKSASTKMFVRKTSGTAHPEQYANLSDIIAAGCFHVGAGSFHPAKARALEQDEQGGQNATLTIFPLGRRS